MSAAPAWAIQDVGRWPAVLALARKELRTGLPLALEALGVVAVLPLGAWLLGALDAFTTSAHRGIALLAAAPLAAAMLGGASVAGERAERTLAFVAARAASSSQVRGVKFVVHGLLALAVLGGCAALVEAWSPARQAGWLEALDLPATLGLGLGLLLVSSTFMLAFAASCYLADPLSAGLAGAVGGASWVALVGCLPGALLARSAEAGVVTAVMLFPPLVAGPSALVAWLVFREDVSRSGTESRARRVGWTLLALGLLPWLVAPWALGLARDQRALAQGRGVVLPEPLLLSPSGQAVAFVAVPEREAGARAAMATDGRAVIAFLGHGDADRFPTVLPRGTRPIAWTHRGAQLVVSWPGGTRRVVDFAGDTRAPDEQEAALPPGNSDLSLRVQDGRLLVLFDGVPTTAYPFSPERSKP